MGPAPVLYKRYSAETTELPPLGSIRAWPFSPEPRQSGGPAPRRGRQEAPGAARSRDEETSLGHGGDERQRGALLSRAQFVEEVPRLLDVLWCLAAYRLVERNGRRMRRAADKGDGLRQTGHLIRGDLAIRCPPGSRTGHSPIVRGHRRHGRRHVGLISFGIPSILHGRIDPAIAGLRPSIARPSSGFPTARRDRC